MHHSRAVEIPLVLLAAIDQAALPRAATVLALLNSYSGRGGWRAPAFAMAPVNLTIEDGADPSRFRIRVNADLLDVDLPVYDCAIRTNGDDLVLYGRMSLPDTARIGIIGLEIGPIAGIGHLLPSTPILSVDAVGDFMMIRCACRRVRLDELVD